jgi:predicted ATPase/serine/threonine protein kinase
MPPGTEPQTRAPHPAPQVGGNSSRLSPGTRFGPYEILASLGAGGMGEVYRAKDTRLEREVAVKILSSALASNRERLSRFAQEARSASVLNHPNIVTIYELGEAESTHYIAMELVKGNTLRELLTAGVIPIRKIIQVAAQVAEGLAKAHKAGIVHRDLKPENLMVCEDGLVKILDFGLAKLAPSNEELGDVRTMDGCQTLPGLIVGTVEYMSPEQVSGRPLDFRSDQFSFGVVLYELVTGKPAFRGNTGVETLAAILRDKPEPVSSHRMEAPAPLCWVAERCLAKEPEKRYASTSDLARDIAAIRDGFSEMPVARPESRPSNLPPQRTAFVGREKELAAAKNLLLRQQVRLVTVTGPGGIGKTRLVLQLASDMADFFPDGIYFAALAAVRDPGLVASVIAQALGVRESGERAPLEALKERLQNSPPSTMLLLLDNFEHLVTAAPVVAELLSFGPSLKILVTSRAALHIYGEHEFPVPPLAVPEDSRSLSSLEVLAQYSAVALFLQRATAVKPDFEITEENAPAVAEICARLDGLPLAIELAAARIKLLSPSAMRTRLASRLQLLTGGARDLPTRQQTLRGAIDWSYDLLNPAEQKLFRRLSAFVGGCTLEAIEAVCDTKSDLSLDLLEGMASMVDKSLMQQVEHEQGESRFIMLETIREYGLEKLTASGEEVMTKRSHAAYCLVLAEECAAEGGAQNAQSLDRFEIEHDNFRAALDWLVQSGEAEWGLRLGAALFRFWETGEYLSEGRDWLSKLLKVKGAAAATKPRARALFAAGVLIGEQGDYASAGALIEESLEISRKLEDKQGVAVSLNALAVHARDRGDIVLSRSLLEQSLALWREAKDRVAVARSLSNLANVLKLQGDSARARSLYEECLSIFRELGDRTGVAWSLNHQGDVTRDQGDTAAARLLYQQSLASFRELGDLWGVAGCLADLGNLARDQRDYCRAHSLYRESMGIFQKLEQKRGIARLLECFACSAAAQFQPERSLRLAGAAAALRQTLGAPLTPAEQSNFEKVLAPARQALANTAAPTAAWFEGWGMPIEQAIEEALSSDSALGSKPGQPRGLSQA